MHGGYSTFYYVVGTKIYAVGDKYIGNNKTTSSASITFSFDLSNIGVSGIKMLKSGEYASFIIGTAGEFVSILQKY